MSDTTITHDSSRLRELVDDIRTVMVTTPEPNGELHGRPMTVQRVDDDGTVWFLVDASAPWLANPLTTVNVAFADGDTWVSACGSGTVVKDANVIDELGDPVSDAWFDEGSTPAALRVAVGHADYWDAPGRLSQLVKMGKAAVTQEPPDMGDRGVIEP
jgi:general stress protein 26